MKKGCLLAALLLTISVPAVAQMTDSTFYTGLERVKDILEGKQTTSDPEADVIAFKSLGYLEGEADTLLIAAQPRYEICPPLGAFDGSHNLDPRRIQL